AIEGSDGKGRKNESPWVRIYDPSMSPSATLGWYVVLHFSRDGTKSFLATCWRFLHWWIQARSATLNK
ncbi:MAG: MrcB family domain-containing protein, partial [Burkholderiales bacterium]